MKPSTILFSLVALAIAFSGWAYAWQNRAQPFSKQEEIMFNLQDQIEILQQENAALYTEIRKLTEE